MHLYLTDFKNDKLILYIKLSDYLARETAQVIKRCYNLILWFKI